jgi:hypothetical protein
MIFESFEARNQMYFRAKLKEKLRVQDALLEVQVSAGHLALSI